MHPQFPLEKTCSHRDERFQLTFARHALQILPQGEKDAYEATLQGLVLRAETESALERPVAVLKDCYGEQIHIGATTVRYHYARELEEPHMGVRVLCPTPYFERVRADLMGRGAVILDAELTREFGVVRATAALKNLLGYAAHLAELTANRAREVMWLSHYAPVRSPPA